MTSVRARPHKLDHFVVQPGPRAGAVRPLLQAYRENVSVRSKRRSALNRSISSFNRSPMFMEPAAQLYDFICPIDLAHIVEDAR